MKYRVKQAIEVEAMRMPVIEDQKAVREVACWMVDNGYVEPGLGVEDVDDNYVYVDKVLPAYGANYLELIPDESGEGIVVDLGTWIVKGVTGTWFTKDADEFDATYEVAS